MKKLILIFYFSVFTFHYSLSQGVWTWMSGDTNQYHEFGIYGTQGIPSINNHPPGLYLSFCWTDLQGNFWLYGGVNGPDFAADMWKFNPNTLEWTWVNGKGTNNLPPVYGKLGIAAPGNTPGSRAWTSCTWVDTSGNLWLYGGGVSLKGTNDVWKYNIPSNEWTWMSGDTFFRQTPIYGLKGVPSVSNTPGARWENGTPWVDMNDKFWLYGGGGLIDSIGGALSDMWMYDPVTNMWTWESGSQNIQVLPVYGSKGVFSITNTPGGREPYAMMTENNGNFLLFGGVGSVAMLSDLWEYNPTINQWAWISGTKIPNATNIVGATCQSDSAFYPDARFENRVWKDCEGNMWMYGGWLNGAREDSTIGDVWVYLSDSKKWARMSNSNYINTEPVYGKRGVASLSNMPGSRCGHAGWTDKKKNFWVFGGSIVDDQHSADMWRYQPDYNCLNISCGCSAYIGVLTSSRDSICEGTNATSHLSDNGTYGSVEWQSSTDGVHFSIIQNDTLRTYTTSNLLTQSTYYRIVVQSLFCGSDTSNTVDVHVVPPPAAGFNYSVNGKQVSFQPDSVSGNVISFHWDFGDGRTSDETNAIHTFDSVKTYYVCLTVYNGLNCSFTRCQYVSAPTGLQDISAGKNSLVLYPNPANNELTIEVLNNDAPKQISITNGLGQTLIQLNTYKTKTQIDVGSLAAGIYFVKTQLSNGRVVANKFVKE